MSYFIKKNCFDYKAFKNIHKMFLYYILECCIDAVANMIYILSDSKYIGKNTKSEFHGTIIQKVIEN